MIEGLISIRWRLFVYSFNVEISPKCIPKAGPAACVRYASHNAVRGTWTSPDNKWLMFGHFFYFFTVLWNRWDLLPIKSKSKLQMPPISSKYIIEWMHFYKIFCQCFVRVVSNPNVKNSWKLVHTYLTGWNIWTESNLEPLCSPLEWILKNFDYKVLDWFLVWNCNVFRAQKAGSPLPLSHNIH